MKPDELAALSGRLAEEANGTPPFRPVHYLPQQLPTQLHHCIQPHSATFLCAPILLLLRANEKKWGADQPITSSITAVTLVEPVLWPCSYHAPCMGAVPGEWSKQDFSITSSFPASCSSQRCNEKSSDSSTSCNITMTHPSYPQRRSQHWWFHAFCSFFCGDPPPKVGESRSDCLVHFTVLLEEEVLVALCPPLGVVPGASAPQSPT